MIARARNYSAYFARNACPHAGQLQNKQQTFNTLPRWVSFQKDQSVFTLKIKNSYWKETMSSENEALLESQDRNKYGAVSPEEAGEEQEVDVVVETPQNASNWATKISGIMFVILSG